MWLLNTTTKNLREFNGNEISKISYAILSHTWLPKDDDGNTQEILFHEADQLSKTDAGPSSEPEIEQTAEHRPGNKKVLSCCEIARRDGYDYVWIDTCCIDKRSSARLSEAITSMYQWYSRAAKCYVYLADFSIFSHRGLRTCRWFKRGWTLQELIASKKVEFFDGEWNKVDYISVGIIGARKGTTNISELTGIGEQVFGDQDKLLKCGVPERMSWAAHRETTEPEDMAYCLMGLFNVQIPIQYGEGAEEAFKRLQLAYMARNYDCSLFAWMAARKSSGLLASSPTDFQDTKWIGGSFPKGVLVPWQMTNLGISITLPLKEIRTGVFTGILSCFIKTEGAEAIGIFLEEVIPSRPETRIMRRIRCNELEKIGRVEQLPRTHIYVQEDDFYRSWS